MLLKSTYYKISWFSFYYIIFVSICIINSQSKSSTTSKTGCGCKKNNNNSTMTESEKFNKTKMMIQDTKLKMHMIRESLRKEFNQVKDFIINSTAKSAEDKRLFNQTLQETTQNLMDMNETMNEMNEEVQTIKIVQEEKDMDVTLNLLYLEGRLNKTNENMEVGIEELRHMLKKRTNHQLLNQTLQSTMTWINSTKSSLKTIEQEIEDLNNRESKAKEAMIQLINDIGDVKSESEARSLTLDGRINETNVIVAQLQAMMEVMEMNQNKLNNTLEEMNLRISLLHNGVANLTSTIITTTTAPMSLPLLMDPAPTNKDPDYVVLNPGCFQHYQFSPLNGITYEKLMETNPISTGYDFDHPLYICRVNHNGTVLIGQLTFTRSYHQCYVAQNGNMFGYTSNIEYLHEDHSNGLFSLFHAKWSDTGIIPEKKLQLGVSSSSGEPLYVIRCKLNFHSNDPRYYRVIATSYSKLGGAGQLAYHGVYSCPNYQFLTC